MDHDIGEDNTRYKSTITLIPMGGAAMKRCVLAILLTALVALAWTGPVSAASNNGAAGQMPAYYDGQLFTINLALLSSGETLIQQNKSINTIYMCDQCESSGVSFVSVLDAIQGDGFNPLWLEVQIAFNAGHAPHQLTFETDILAWGASGASALASTAEVSL